LSCALSSRTAFAQRITAPRVSSKASKSAARGVSVMAGSFYDLSAKTIDGKDFSFDQLKGKVVLITNVASA
jgi:hypothetical protein